MKHGEKDDVKNDLIDTNAHVSQLVNPIRRGVCAEGIKCVWLSRCFSARKHLTHKRLKRLELIRAENTLEIRHMRTLKRDSGPPGKELNLTLYPQPYTQWTHLTMLNEVRINEIAFVSVRFHYHCGRNRISDTLSALLPLLLLPVWRRSTTERGANTSDDRHSTRSSTSYHQHTAA